MRRAKLVARLTGGGFGVRRRAFITLLGGAAAAWPLVARAQQSRLPVIGFLHPLGGSAEARAPMVAAFRQGLAEAGYVEGQNVAIEFQWAEARSDPLPALAAELVRRQVAVLVAAGGDAAAKAAKSATSSIPIVFAQGGDPVTGGLVKSLARPDADVTGVTFFTTVLGPKRLELLRELVPKAATIAMLVHPGSMGDSIEVGQAARALGLPLRTLHAASDQEIDAAFRSLGQERPEGLLIISNPLFTDRREQIVTLANHYRIPTVYPLREYVAAGGVLSYGASIKDAYRQAGVYAGRILSGAKPPDLPILQPTRFELLINLRTAKALGLEIPPTVLARADEVIE
jgi:putative tryptophan/tyrosine transport system substrate-binding protein